MNLSQAKSILGESERQGGSFGMMSWWQGKRRVARASNLGGRKVVIMEDGTKFEGRNAETLKNLGTQSR
jgi:hypothetical protein